MTKQELHDKFKLEDFFYYHDKENYEHNGFTFKQGEYYELCMGEHGIFIIDDDNEFHDIYYMSPDKLSSF